jgi:enoyl-CoA hydratase/carnithine racemase
MLGTDEVSVREVGSVGRITLTRAKALNSLTHGMVDTIDKALLQWRQQSAINLVLVDAEGDRAFCAGGDLVALHRAAVANQMELPRKFWVDEYRLNADIERYPVPYVAIMDGIVMGGGVGISAHGSHRVVTERSTVAMPECAIGMVPDAGGTFLLSRAPGRLGEFLALTGWRMTGSDAILAGFADIMVSSADLQMMKSLLEANGDISTVESFRQSPTEAPLGTQMRTIERHFGEGTAIDCLLSLEADPDDFAQNAAAAIRRASPLSIACAFDLVRQARELSTLEEALAAEYRFTYRSMTEGQFVEGIRAQIVDKDREPKWRPSRLEEVAAEAVTRMLAPLTSAELTFPGAPE